MTCKDCFHYKPCGDTITWNNTEQTKDDCCKHFKDKSKIVELPCAVGDYVYRYCETLGRILKYQVNSTVYHGVYFQAQIEAIASQDGELIDVIEFNTNDIDRDVFYTEKEAKKALAERKE